MSLPPKARGLLGVVMVAVAAVTVVACTRRTVTFGAGTVDELTFAVDAGDVAPRAEIDAGPGLCIATTCPEPWATCPASDGTLPAYACGTDLSSDSEHCGACGVVCRSPSSAYHVHLECASGQCQAFCTDDHVDCNGIPDDGCEVDVVDDPENCGTCGVKCAPGVVCVAGKCGCPAGTTECSGRCVDLSSDDSNCGACGFACADHPPADAGALPPHMAFGCNAGKCEKPGCVQNGSEFWADCNHELDPDGCEVDLRSDPNHCGTCETRCDPGQQCFSSGAGPECQCKQGQTLCPGSGLEGPYCAGTDDDPRNCGGCGYVCPVLPGSKATCSHGRCGSECLPKRADCNGLDDDGCEVDLDKDPRSCGSCGAMCDVGVGQPCVGGRCATRDCDGPVAK